MTTLYDIMDIERQNSHLVGEVKDAKSILKEYLTEHQAKNGGRECHCHECTQARAWLARNR